jgi:hypothetical protein
MGAARLPVGQRAYFLGGAKVARKMLDVGKTQGLGNLMNRHLGFDQELRDLVGAQSADFVQDGIAQLVAKPFFQDPPGRSSASGHLADV